MNITFERLNRKHFCLLLKWLETPHVKAWWDQDAHWTLELIQEKYSSYVRGYKVEKNISKPINAYIIYVDEKEVGYIQVYNAYDFPRTSPLIGLPASLAAFDVLIGEVNYLKRGIGSEAIALFLNQYARTFTHVFVDPDSSNIAAIRAYEKVGFKKIEYQPIINEIWMIREQKNL